MPKGEYTRTEAGRRAYFVVTGIELPNTLTHEEIKGRSRGLSMTQKQLCHELYIHYMSIGRKKYKAKYASCKSFDVIKDSNK